METFFKDIRYAVRTLLKRRGFTSLAVLTLALGIGACTAIFSVVNGVLLRSLPYPEAERLESHVAEQAHQTLRRAREFRSLSRIFSTSARAAARWRGSRNIAAEQRPLLAAANLSAQLLFGCPPTFSGSSVPSRFLAAPSLRKRASRAAPPWPSSVMTFGA